MRNKLIWIAALLGLAASPALSQIPYRAPITSTLVNSTFGAKAFPNTWSGANTFSAATTFSGNISSSGTNTWSGANTFSGALSVGDLTTSGDLTIGDDLNVTGTVSASDFLSLEVTNASIFNGPITANGSADFIDAVTMHSTLGITGATTANGDLKAASTLTLDEQVNAAATGANAALTLTKAGVILTNASLTSIGTIASPATGRTYVITNKTGAAVSIVNEYASGTAAQRIVTGTGGDLTLASDASIWVRYNGNNSRWHVVGGTGSGSGAGGVNLITNYTGDSNASGWTCFADAAATSPADGTGGSPTVTLTQSTSSPIIGTGSFVYTKDAANRQGQGCAYQFTVDTGYRAKVMQIEFEYLVGSGTFSAGTSSADSDVTLWIYDVTNSTLIQPSTYKLYASSTSISTRHVSNFQTSATGSTYRLILYSGSTSASAYTLKVDDVTVKPSQYVYGTPITDWQSFPSVAAGTLITGTTSNPSYGTVSVNAARWRRVGGDAEVEWNFAQTTAGGLGSGAYLFNLPSPLVLDSSVYTFNTNVSASSTTLSAPNVVGDFRAFYEAGVGGKSIGSGAVIPYSSTQLKVYLSYVNEGAGADSDYWGPFYGLNLTPESYTLRARFKVQGWAATAQMSDQADSRVVAARYYGSSSSIAYNSDTTVVYSTKDYDTHAALSNSTGRFTAPVQGTYSFKAAAIIGSLTTATGPYILSAYKNGVQISTGPWFTRQGAEAMVSIADSVTMNAGDYLEIKAYQADVASAARSISVNGNAVRNYFAVERLSQASLMSATETVAARYKTSTSRTMSAPYTSPTVAIFETIDYDTHGAYNISTGIYTCPAPGYYRVGVKWISNSTAMTAGQSAGAWIRKNGSNNQIISVQRVASTAAITMDSVGGGTVQCNAGDQLAVAYYSDTATATQASAPDFNWVTFERIK